MITYWIKIIYSNRSIIKYVNFIKDKRKPLKINKVLPINKIIQTKKNCPLDKNNIKIDLIKYVNSTKDKRKTTKNKLSAVYK